MDHLIFYVGYSLYTKESVIVIIKHTNQTSLLWTLLQSSNLQQHMTHCWLSQYLQFSVAISKYLCLLQEMYYIKIVVVLGRVVSILIEASHGQAIDRMFITGIVQRQATGGTRKVRVSTAVTHYSLQRMQ